MGLFDTDNECFFGGLFDINGDGKTSLSEQWLAHKVFEECSRDDADEGAEFGVDPEDYETEDEYMEALEEEKYAWRDTCEDGLEFGVDPEDYETEDEYIEALEEEKYAWRDTCEDGLEFGVDPEDYETEDEYIEALEEARASDTSFINIPVSIEVSCPALDKLNEIKEEDYPNKRRYNAAYTLSNEFRIYSNEEYEQKEKACCKFIVENAGKILAANYLSYDSGFLYAQAIKDNFNLPCSLPDEDETREMEFSQVLTKIAKRNISLSFEIWSWCLDQFLPYSQYDEYAENDLSVEVINDLYNFPDGYKKNLVHYMADNPDFCKKIMVASGKTANRLPELIVEAIKESLYITAETLFKTGLEKAGGQWKIINTLTEGVILCCKNYKELESIEYFRDTFLPIVKVIPDGMVQDEIPEWEKNIAEYIDYVEDECEQYVFTRKNAWRKSVPDGTKYGLDPRYYDTKQEYLEALNEARYGWRKWYKDSENYGLSVDSFETQEEYREALNTKLREMRQQERDKKRQEYIAEQSQKQDYADEKTIYIYCGVLLPFSSQPYSFRTEDKTIQIGDTVIVPVGENKKEMKGTVVSVGQYLRLGVPYPVEKTKMIIQKVEEKKK